MPSPDASPVPRASESPTITGTIVLDGADAVTRLGMLTFTGVPVSPVANE